MSAVAPDLVTPVVAYRAWKVVGDGPARVPMGAVGSILATAVDDRRGERAVGAVVDAQRAMQLAEKAKLLVRDGRRAYDAGISAGRAAAEIEKLGGKVEWNANREVVKVTGCP